MRNESFESTVRETPDVDLADVERNLHEIYDWMDEVFRKYRVPTGSREASLQSLLVMKFEVARVYTGV